MDLDEYLDTSLPFPESVNYPVNKERSFDSTPCISVNPRDVLSFFSHDQQILSASVSDGSVLLDHPDFIKNCFHLFFYLQEQNRQIYEVHGFNMMLGEKKKDNLLREVCEKYISLVKEVSLKYPTPNEKLHYELLFMYLIEVMLLRKPEPTVNYLLITWNNTFVNDERILISEEQKILLNQRTPTEIFSNKNFWDLVYKISLRGKVDKVFKMIEKYLLLKMEEFDQKSGYDEEDVIIRNKDGIYFAEKVRRKKSENVYKMAYNVLSKGFVPVFFPHSDRKKFLHNYYTWRKHFEQILDSESQLSDQWLRRLFEIFVGNRETIRKVCRNWIDYFIALLVYSDPMLDKNDIFGYIMNLEENSRPDLPNNPIDNIVMMIIDINNINANVFKLLQFASKYVSKWFLCHVCNLLYVSDYVDSKVVFSDDLFFKKRKKLQNEEHYQFISDIDEGKDKEVNFVEHYIIEYAKELFSRKKYWNLALNYFTYCERRGDLLLKLYINKIPIDDEKRLEQIVDLLEKNKDKFKVDDIIRSIHKSFGTNCYKKLFYVKAITHLFLAQDFKSIHELGTELLEDNFNHFTKIDTCIEFQSSTNQLICIGEYLREEEKLNLLGLDILRFISKFSLALKHYKEKKYEESGKVIVDILKERTYFPQKYIYLLLLLSHKAIENDKETENVFSKDDILLLLNSLMQLTTFYSDKEFMKDIEIGNFNTFRNNFVRCFSRKVTRNN